MEKERERGCNDAETSGQIARITKENAFMIKHGERAKYQPIDNIIEYCQLY